jgi:hypothetical protein
VVVFNGKGVIHLQTKVMHPFIYFYIEPNIVFVYKMETHRKYITVTELISEGLETFELSPGASFETFHHKEHKPLEDRPYFINQVDIANMVDEVNSQIQKFPQREEGGSPVHIVSPEFAAGSLRVGLKRPKTVIGFPDFFSIGPLWKLEEKLGQTFRNEWLYENINYEQDDYEYRNKFQHTLREIADLPNQVPIYIWYGNNGSEQTGLRYILYLLKDKTNEIFLLNSTELYSKYISSKIEDQPIFHTGQIAPEDLRLIFEKEKGSMPLSDNMRNQFQREWQALSQTSEVLRVWVNGEIKSVPENHFDPLIIKTVEGLHRKQAEKEFIKAGTLIGEIISQNAECDSYFLEYRIRTLIYNGILELKGIPKSMRHYRVKLAEA